MDSQNDMVSFFFFKPTADVQSHLIFLFHKLKWHWLQQEFDCHWLQSPFSRSAFFPLEVFPVSGLHLQIPDCTATLQAGIAVPVVPLEELRHRRWPAQLSQSGRGVADTGTQIWPLLWALSPQALRHTYYHSDTLQQGLGKYVTYGNKPCLASCLLHCSDAS